MKLYYSIAFCIVIGLTVASGVLQGKMQDRWGHSPEILAAAERLEQLPTEFGSWELVESGELDENSQQILDSYGAHVATYWNSETGAQVYASIILGPPGTIANHTPEVCFSKQLYRPRRALTTESLENNKASERPHTFWCRIFKRTDVHGCLVPAYWAWTTDGCWEAATGGRYKYASSPYLYKVQVSCNLMPGTWLSDSDPCKEFLADFVPAAAICFVPPEEK